MKKNRSQYLKLLDYLTDALGRSNDQTLEEIKHDLKDAGINVDATLARLEDFQSKIAMQVKRSALDFAREKRLLFTQKGHEFIGKFNGWNKEQLIQRIKELSSKEIGLAYRDLETMGTDEISAILEDLETAYKNSMEDNGEQNE